MSVVCHQLDSETCATLDAAALDNSTPGSARHTSTKPMGTGTVTCMWLMCSLWHILHSIAYLWWIFKLLVCKNVTYPAWLWWVIPFSLQLIHTITDEKLHCG